MYNEYEIRPMPLSVRHCRLQVERFLQDNGLRLDDVDYYACVFSIGNDEHILAGGGLSGNIIKCIAVSDELREEGFSSRLVSHLISEANAKGYSSIKVFTKPSNQTIFENLSFKLTGKSPKAILMENGNELREYCHYLSGQRRYGESGVIVMNANPFTRGHRYLIEQAAQQVEWLHVIVVKEDCSVFPYQERKAMIEHGTSDLSNVMVCEGSCYAVSSTTFPTYFLKEISDATDTQIQLDLDIFVHFIAPHLGIKKRFIGSEPTDLLTNRYNQLIHQILPQYGYEVIEIDRLANISASSVRHYLQGGLFSQAAALVCRTTIPYLFAYVATLSLQQELDTTPKPGLIDRHDKGAHQDMDYHLMSLSIQTLRPYFYELCSNGDKPIFSEVKSIGLRAEKDMLSTTGGVNTHKGALFSIGLTLSVAAYLYAHHGSISIKDLQEGIMELARQFPRATGTHGDEVKKKHPISGALENAISGYSQLFNDWLPFYRSLKDDPYQHHKTLLHIMSMLDDTNVYYRKGIETAEKIKKQGAQLLERFSIESLKRLNEDFIHDNISPGGCADMLSLTILIHLLTNTSMN